MSPSDDRWLPGVVCKITDPVSFLVQLTDRRTRRCHQDQLCKHNLQVDSPSDTMPSQIDVPVTASTGSTSPEMFSSYR